MDTPSANGAKRSKDLSNRIEPLSQPRNARPPPPCFPPSPTRRSRCRSCRDGICAPAAAAPLSGEGLSSLRSSSSVLAGPAFDPAFGTVPGAVHSLSCRNSEAAATLRSEPSKGREGLPVRKPRSMGFLTVFPAHLAPPRPSRRGLFFAEILCRAGFGFARFRPTQNSKMLEILRNDRRWRGVRPVGRQVRKTQKGKHYETTLGSCADAGIRFSIARICSR